MMKRILSALLCAVLLCLCCACGSDPAPTAETRAPTASATEAADNDEAIARYLEKLRSGAFGDDRLYRYDDLTEYLQIGAYENLRYPADPAIDRAVTEEDARDYLTVWMLQTIVTDEQYSEPENAEVRKYDVVNIDFEGFADGEKLPSGSASGRDLLIGSGDFIPGFEDGLIGAKAGETRELALRFSVYYGDPSLAGKEVLFRVTVNSIRRPLIPTLSAELVNSTVNTSYATTEELLEDVRADLEVDRGEKADQLIMNYLKYRIVGDGVKQLPEREMQHYRDHYDAYYAQYAASSGMSMEDFLLNYRRMTMAEYETEREEFAKDSVITDLFTFLVAKDAGLEWTDQGMRDLILGMLHNSSQFQNASQLIDSYTSLYDPEYFATFLLNHLVNEKILETAQMEESV